MQLLPGSNKRASLLPNEVRLSHGKKLGYPSSSTMRNGTCAQSSILIFSLGNETSTLPAQRCGLTCHRAKCTVRPAPSCKACEQLRKAGPQSATLVHRDLQVWEHKAPLKASYPKAMKPNEKPSPLYITVPDLTEIPRKNIISWAWKQILQPSQALDDCDPGQHLDCSVARDPESKSPSQALTSWPLETS